MVQDLVQIQGLTMSFEGTGHGMLDINAVVLPGTAAAWRESGIS